ncbi:hypothetical protein GWI33_021125 [Rhynchophorus ferrugineus]|uniref:Uncharacterized protein n=1 Tax=Rhynchophorus ferrugineus TaxID=354439 RepID=A0A834M3J8_RHYFE|nr:hypothetical protein GWI33_021125 [Rhynchophorus ferrugineus]
MGHSATTNDARDALSRAATSRNDFAPERRAQKPSKFNDTRGAADGLRGSAKFKSIITHRKTEHSFGNVNANATFPKP